MKQLQYGFSAAYEDAAFSHEGRERKANKVLAILEDAVGDLSDKHLLDIGCSAGIMTHCYARKFGRVTGTDIDMPAVAFAAGVDEAGHLSWAVADSQRLPFPESSFDVVTCTHIYEHVPDARLLMAEIFRVLRPGGTCFFSAGNRFSLIEPHYRLPFLSVIPKAMAHWYLRLLGRGSHYYETHFSYWGLRRLVTNFELEDYTMKVVVEPQKYFAEDMVPAGGAKQKLVLFALRTAYWICPTYLWVLRKSAN
jgi:2-polyprenyl-3-methyl-5-hydroxy-6-metoxy-1,4-benzoquinol methylase